jgi:hypothetical protein
MSTIPNSAMPHAYVHEDADTDGARRPLPSAGWLIGGGAVAAYLIYRLFR